MPEVLRLAMEGSDEGTTFVDTSPLAHIVTLATTTYGLAVTDTASPAVGSSSARFENKNGNDSGCRLLLHLDNNVTDSSENAVSVTNSGITFSTVGQKYGTHWGVFASPNYLQCASSASWRFGTGDGAVDCWITVNSAGNIIRHGKIDGTEIGWYIDADATHIKFNYTTDGSTVVTSTVKIPYTAGTRLHMAFNRYGNTFYGFKNGVLVGSENWTGVSIFASLNILRIGEASTASFGGNIDELRIGIGARWYEDFPLRDYAYGPAQGLGFTANGAALEIDHHADFNVGDDDFDLEFRFKPWDSLITTTVLENPVLINKGNVNDTEISFIIQIVDSGDDALLQFRYSSTGAVGSTTAFNHTILKAEFSDWSNTAWKKIKYSRRTTNLYLYIDDVLEETFNISTNAIANTTRKLRIGARWVNSQSALHQGPSAWIDQVVWTVLSNPTTATVDGTVSGAYCPYVSQGQVRKMVTNVTGLDHLNGEQVYVQADGVPEESQDYTVSGGTLDNDLPNPAAVIHVGLKYRGVVKLLKSSDGNPAGSGQMKMRRIFLAGIRVFRSLGMKIGLDEDHLDSVKLPDRVTVKPALPLFTGDIEKLPNTTWKKDAQLFIIQDKPMPLFILALINQSEVENP